MVGRHYSKDQLYEIIFLRKEGLVYREIAERLGRNEAGIRNQFYRKRLTERTRSETKIIEEKNLKLKGEMGALQESLTRLQDQQTELSKSITALQQKNDFIQQTLEMNKLMLKKILMTALIDLKRMRPDLFMFNQQEQLSVLVNCFFKRILK